MVKSAVKLLRDPNKKNDTQHEIRYEEARQRRRERLEGQTRDLGERNRRIKEELRRKDVEIKREIEELQKEAERRREEKEREI